MAGLDLLDSLICHQHRRYPEVLAVFGEPRRMGHKRLRPSFETPRKRAAPQDDGWLCRTRSIRGMPALYHTFHIEGPEACF
jgi:hypothetical protein